MKKYLLSLMTIVMVAMTSMCFVSCGDDDDDSENSSEVLPYIVGTWSSSSLKNTVTFNSNMTGEVTVERGGNALDKIPAGQFTFTCYSDEVDESNGVVNKYYGWITAKYKDGQTIMWEFNVSTQSNNAKLFLHGYDFLKK